MAVDADLDTKQRSPGRRLWLGTGVASAALYLVLNLATATRQPIVFVDEVMYSDPAVNLVLHGQWRSGAWFAPPTQFWAGNAPLYPLLLAAWMRGVGVGLWQARSLNYLFMAATVALFVTACRRGGWCRDDRSTALLAIATTTVDAFHVSYRYGRSDILSAMFAAAWFWCVTGWSAHHKVQLSSAARRRSLLGAYVSAGAMFAASYATAIAAGFFVLVILAADRSLWPRFRAPLVAGAVGVVSAGTLLLATFATKGALGGWAHSMFTHSGASLSGFRLREFVDGYASPGLWATLIATGLVAWRLRDEPGARLRKALWMACACMPFVPLLLRGTVPSPGYLWQSFVPLAWLLFADAWPHLSERHKRALVALVVFVALTGTPLRIANAVRTWNARDYGPVERFTTAVASREPEDVLLDHGAYFAIAAHARVIFTSTVLPSLDARQRARVGLILARPENVQTYAGELGGCWRPVATLGAAAHAAVDASVPAYASPRYELVALRRSSAPCVRPAATQ